jgi:hypothetical protein
MPRVPAKDGYLDFWEPRVGRKSATYMWWSKMVVASAPRVVLADVVVIFAVVMLKLHFALALAWVVGAVGVAFLASGVFALLLSCRIATKALGVRVTPKSFPPVDNDMYRNWCKRNGISPFRGKASRD